MPVIGAHTLSFLFLWRYAFFVPLQFPLGTLGVQEAADVPVPVLLVKRYVETFGFPRENCSILVPGLGSTAPLRGRLRSLTFFSCAWAGLIVARLCRMRYTDCASPRYILSLQNKMFYPPSGYVLASLD